MVVCSGVGVLCKRELEKTRKETRYVARGGKLVRGEAYCMVRAVGKNNKEEHKAVEKQRGQLVCVRAGACIAARGCHRRCDACKWR
jgi:hypothetical protein